MGAKIPLFSRRSEMPGARPTETLVSCSPDTAVCCPSHDPSPSGTQGLAPGGTSVHPC